MNISFCVFQPAALLLPLPAHNWWKTLNCCHFRENLNSIFWLFDPANNFWEHHPQNRAYKSIFYFYSMGKKLSHSHRLSPHAQLSWNSVESNYYFDKQKRQLIGGGFVELELECLMMAAMIGAWQRSWPHDWLTEATRLLLLLPPCEAAHSCMTATHQPRGGTEVGWTRGWKKGETTTMSFEFIFQFSVPLFFFSFLYKRK